MRQKKIVISEVEVEYSLNELDPGSHTIEFKVWDVLIILPNLLLIL